MLEIRLRGGDKLLFTCCYRSPIPSETSEQINERLDQLLKCISQKKYSHVCIVGDLNFKDINWSTWTTVHGENSVEATFINVIRDCFYYQHVEEETRRRGCDNPSLLDLVLKDEQMQVSEVLHHATLGKSDHDLSTFQLHCYLDFAKPKEKYDFSKGDCQAMRENLGSSTWIQDYMQDNEDTSVEEKWLNLKGKLTELAEKFVPKGKVSENPSWKIKGSFPIDANTRDAIRNKTKTYRAWKRTRPGNDRDAARQKYTKAG